MRIVIAVVLGTLAGWTPVGADIRVVQETRMQAGPGASATSQMPAMRSSVAVKGPRRLSTTRFRGELVDFAGEVVYDIDLVQKTYTVTSFATLRDRARAMQLEAQRQIPEPSTLGPNELAVMTKQAEDAMKLYAAYAHTSHREVTGRSRVIAGLDAREVITRASFATREQAMETVMTEWIASTASPIEELSDFTERYTKAIGLPSVAPNAAGLAPVPIARPSGPDDAAPSGLVVLRTTEYRRPEPVVAEGDEKNGKRAEGSPSKLSRVGRALGGLARAPQRLLTRRAGDEPQSEAIPTMENEVVSVSTVVPDADVALPPGLKQVGSK